MENEDRLLHIPLGKFLCNSPICLRQFCRTGSLEAFEISANYSCDMFITYISNRLKRYQYLLGRDSNAFARVLLKMEGTLLGMANAPFLTFGLLTGSCI